MAWTQIFGSLGTAPMAPTPSQMDAFAAFQKRGAAVAVAEPQKVETRERLFPPAAEPSAATVTPADVDRDVLSQHASLAAKLGVHSDAGRELGVAEFESFLQECGLRVYDEKQVAAYLTSHYGVEKTEQGQKMPTWGWRPAREQDSNGMARGVTTGPNGQIQRSARTYRKTIPIPVLLTVERVVEKFPDVRLYVSDEIQPREFVKDPFLMVVCLDRRYIIERWDEPNYRER